MSRRIYNSSDARRYADEKPLAAERAEKYRTAWRRDYARLIHCAAFRRLQGKTQLFPNHESDFFRNRLTHSFEVAQIAKSIAIRLNATEKPFQHSIIEPDIVEVAALAHDLGHPPFGHNGEEALDAQMVRFGGFEGNAQTLRILTKLEKKRTLDGSFDPVSPGGQDNRGGLNLTARVLAAVLKYDSKIPIERKERKEGEVEKGYYDSEELTVIFLKKSVAGSYRFKNGNFKTIECHIMDISDDIAYSTYDLEDAFRGGFSSPLAMISADTTLLNEIAEVVKARLDKYYADLPTADRRFDARSARDCIIATFGRVLELSNQEILELSQHTPTSEQLLAVPDYRAFMVARAFDISSRIANDGYRRTQLTSELVGNFIGGAELIYNKDCPPLSRVRLKVETFKVVETLKVFAFETVIKSSNLKLAEHSGKEILTNIFKEIYEEPKGFMLLPQDFRSLYEKFEEPRTRARLVCDFVAGMTDRYAIEFYSRLRSPTQATIWKPL